VYSVRLAPISPATSGERGINGIAVDPDFSTNGRLWVYYTYLEPPARSRLSTFVYDAATDLLSDEQVILEGLPLGTEIHNGGCLEFAPDKTLFLGMGDDFSFSSTAQDPFDLRGAKLPKLHLEGFDSRLFLSIGRVQQAEAGVKGHALAGGGGQLTDCGVPIAGFA